jgi:hypothetical protein
VSSGGEIPCARRRWLAAVFRKPSAGRGRRRKRLALGVGVGLAGLALFGPEGLQLARQAFLHWTTGRRLSQLEAERERLLAERERLERDPVYVEGLIRTTFKWAQPDEYVIPLNDAAADRPE